MTGNKSFTELSAALRQRPHAAARIFGSPACPDISGCVHFYQTKRGVLVAAEIFGLPQGQEHCPDGIFAFHIHSGSSCSGTEADPFADAMTHYDPEGVPHPCHAGDLPPLFANHGYALQVFLTDRFSVREVLQKTVIIHASPDDFTTQPSGNAGTKIACGEIKALGCC